jgi:predicted RNase H-like HicB family nuclease
MKRLSKKIPVVIEKTKSGFSAYAESVDVYTTGKDIPSLYTNLLEALNLFYEESGYLVETNNLKLNLDLRQFFQYYKVLNANFLAERIGMNPGLLSQYVKGKKQPSTRQADRIVRGIQMIGKELADINLQ